MLENNDKDKKNITLIKKNLKKLNKIGGNSLSPILLKVVFVPMIAIARIANKIL